jgi:hypothetical protein
MAKHTTKPARMDGNLLNPQIQLPIDKSISKNTALQMESAKIEFIVI